jgi:hypothetical protein
MTEASSCSLKRVSTLYVDREDRVRLTGQAADGAPKVIWLTQRLLQRMIPVLLQWLEQQDPKVANAEVLRSWAQQKARAALVLQSPVQPHEDSDTWLAESVDVAKRARGVRLTFKGVREEQAVVALAVKGLRQWLNIVYGAYLKAGWPVDIWPEWIRDSATPRKRRATVLH